MVPDLSAQMSRAEVVLQITSMPISNNKASDNTSVPSPTRKWDFVVTFYEHY